MSTTIRPKISEKNKYAIGKHRYYELKHFVMQYPEWKAQLKELNGFKARTIDISFDERWPSDPTHNEAVLREEYIAKIHVIDICAKETDPIIGPIIVKGILDGSSFDILKLRFNIPCCRDIYYTLYRKFFWLLDKTRK